MARAPQVAVVGASEASEAELHVAEEVGAGLVGLGAVVVTGGLGGVMEAACRGARSKRGVTLGLLPGDRRDDANGWVQIGVPTGMGEMRNALVVRSADVVVAIGGGMGTLSEVALAVRAGTPVVGVGSWELQGVEQVGSAAEALEHVRALLP